MLSVNRNAITSKDFARMKFMPKVGKRATDGTTDPGS